MRTRSRGIDHAHRDRDHARATPIVKYSEANLCNYGVLSIARRHHRFLSSKTFRRRVYSWSVRSEKRHEYSVQPAFRSDDDDRNGAARSEALTPRGARAKASLHRARCLRSRPRRFPARRFLPAAFGDPSATRGDAFPRLPSRDASPDARRACTCAHSPRPCILRACR